jgi:YD repeat-containing protein
MKHFIVPLLALLALPLLSQTNPNATGARVWVGPTADSISHAAYQTFVIPADQQQGVGLDPNGDNSAKFGGVTGASLPWFMRINRPSIYIYGKTPDASGPEDYGPITNPVIAYGEAGGGTALYTDREYRFGMYAGGRTLAKPGEIRIRAYQKSQFTGSAMNQAAYATRTFTVPFPGDTNWDAFLAAGSRHVEPAFNGLKVAVELLSGDPVFSWHGLENPYVVTLSCGNPDMYFVVDCKGWVPPDLPLAVTAMPPSAGNQAFRPVFSVDFTARPTWRSAYLDSPHFNGKAVPSDYSGMSERELSGLGGFSPPVPGAGYETATQIDGTPELRQHPKLDKLVMDLGNDPVAIANFVHNEIKLVDPLAYSEDEQTDPSGIWAGGMNRNAFNTYMEGAGNPWEQCALLVYMMRKAGHAAVYVEPAGDSQFLLDTQLEKILRMRVRDAADSAGDMRMPEEVPVHYPWVAVHVPDEENPGQKKWVHLFPWMKDTSVIEGRNLYEKFPDDTKNGSEWVKKYLKADPTVMGELTAAHLPNGDGNILVEAERYQDSVAGGEALHNTAAGIDKWHKKTDTGSAGYYGDSWMQAVGEGTVSAFSSAAKSPKLEYVVNLPAAGTYYVWLRAYAGHNYRNCFVTINGQSYQTFQLASGSGWQWGNRNPSNQRISFTVTTAGRHTLRIAGAHSGFALDRVLLTASSALAPSGEGGMLSAASDVGSNVPSYHFINYAKEKLAAHGLSLDDVGMRYLDRKNNRTSVNDFPRPYRLDSAAHIIHSELSDRPDTFNTVRVHVAKDPMTGSNFADPNVQLDTGDWLAMDLQNRPFYINVRKTADRQFKLMATLAPFRSLAGDPENFTTGDKARMQRREVAFDYLPNNGATTGVMENKANYTTEVTHVRQRRAIQGNITRAGVINGGSGYTSAPVVTIAPPPNLATQPTYRTATAQAIVTAGKVTKIVIVDPGYGYQYDAAAPAVTLSGGGGSGATAEVAPPSRNFGAGMRDIHPLGIRASDKIINRPKISEGDLGALCLTFGDVSQRVVDHLAEDYWTYEKRMKGNPSEANDVEFREAVQARSTYLVGMDYYRRVSEFAGRNADLHKGRMLSLYGAGFSKLQAQRKDYWVGAVGSGLQYKDALPADGQFHHDKPGVDMFFLESTATAAEAVHTDAGFPGNFNTRSMWEIYTTEASAQEHQIINDYYREDAAMSTVRLLQRAQLNQDRVSPATGAIRLTQSNLPDNKDDVYVRGTVSAALKNWNVDIWSLIETFLSGEEGKFNEVYITPGNVSSPSLSYNGVGAMLLGRNKWSALIGGSAGFYNGGFGSSFSVPRFESTYLPSNTLSYGSTGYTLSLGSTSTASVSMISAAASLWNMPSTYTSLNTGSSVASSYQSFAWSQQATSYGTSGSLASNFLTTQSRGAVGSTSFFGALGNSLSSIGSAIGTVVSQIGGFVSDPVDVVTGDFYLDAVDLTLPGPMPLTLRRNYSSLSVADGEFGHGWKSSLLPYIGVGDNSLLYAAEEDGSVIAYRQNTGDANLFTPGVADNPSLKNLNGDGAGGSSNPMNNRIVKSVESGSTYYTLSGANGSVRRFKVREFPVGSGTELISRERPYLESWTDAQGNQLSFTYHEVATDANYGQLAKVTASNGNSLGFNYDVSGHVLEAWTQDGRRVSYQYDLQGDLKKVTLPDGAEHRYDYAEEVTLVGGETVRTSKHLLIRETKPGGRILENDYDSQRRVVRQRAVVGPTAQPVQNAEFIYANSQNPDKTGTGTTTVKDAYGRPTVFTYANSLITSEDDPETPAEVRAWYGATETGGGAYPRSLKSITDRRGVVKFFKYDSRGNLIEKSLGTDLVPADIDGDGIESAGEKSVTSWTYNGQDLPETQTEPSGIVTKWFYDDPLYPHLASRTEKWSGATLISRTRRQFTSKTVAGKFAKGLIEWEKVAEGTPDEAVVEWEYSERGFPTKKTSHTGTTDPDVVVALKHNLRGELIEEKQLSSGGAPERTWVHSYDAMGRKTISTRSGGAVTATEQTHYTLNGEVEWTDGGRTGVNDRVLNRYDSHGRLIEKIEWLSAPMADGSGVGAHVNSDDSVATTFYSYDLFNNLIEIRTPGRHSIAADYDSIGRLKKLDHYGGYKGQGGVIKGSRGFEYEPGGEVSEETDTLGGVTTNYYNARGQLRKRGNPDGSVEEWRFYPDGRPHKEILRNGSYKELVYDDANRTVAETLKAADHSVIKTAVSIHDRRGNLISETKGGYTTVTTYDSLDRVKSVAGPPATLDSAQRIDTYSYPDPHGRRTLVTNLLNETTITLRDALDRVVSIERKNADDSTASIVTHAYSSDHNKVTTTQGSGADAIVTERWTDTMGRTILVRRTDGTFSTTVYNPAGDPIIQQDTDGSQTTRLFDWQGLTLREVRPGNVVVEFVHDSAGNLLERKMPGGMTAKAQFDSAGRVTETKLVQGASTTRLITYVYYPANHGDWAGMLQSTTDARGIVTTRTYDSRLRLAATVSDGPDPEDDLSRFPSPKPASTARPS